MSTLHVTPWPRLLHHPLPPAPGPPDRRACWSHALWRSPRAGRVPLAPRSVLRALLSGYAPQGCPTTVGAQAATPESASGVRSRGALMPLKPRDVPQSPGRLGGHTSLFSRSLSLTESLRGHTRVSLHDPEPAPGSLKRTPRHRLGHRWFAEWGVTQQLALRARSQQEHSVACPPGGRSSLGSICQLLSLAG